MPSPSGASARPVAGPVVERAGDEDGRRRAAPRRGTWSRRGTGWHPSRDAVDGAVVLMLPTIAARPPASPAADDGPLRWVDGRAHPRHRRRDRTGIHDRLLPFDHRGLAPAPAGWHVPAGHHRQRRRRHGHRGSRGRGLPGRGSGVRRRARRAGRRGVRAGAHRLERRPPRVRVRGPAVADRAHPYRGCGARCGRRRRPPAARDHRHPVRRDVAAVPGPVRDGRYRGRSRDRPTSRRPCTGSTSASSSRASSATRAASAWWTSSPRCATATGSTASSSAARSSR